MNETKRVAIVQSCYIPWKGYFDMINRVDEFILYDDCQYTRQDWRNRNRIKTPQGAQWLTIPVKSRHGQRIDETHISDSAWGARHWKTLTQNYGRAPYFEDYSEHFERIYREARNPLLSLVNKAFLEDICSILGITTRLTWSTDYEVEGAKTARVVALCQAADATSYLSGPRARDYLEEDLFAEAGIALEYMDYTGYPEYPQLYPPFDHAVTVLDLLFNTGPDASRFMSSFAARRVRA